MSLVQIALHTGRIDRVREGVTPVVQLDLEENQRVVSIDLIDWTARFGNFERKTHDWEWRAYVETRS